MGDTIFPYRAWLLNRNYQPLEIELVGKSFGSSSYAQTQSGRIHRIDELYPTKDEAIAMGEAKLAAMAAELTTKRRCLRRHKAELERHK